MMYIVLTHKGSPHALTAFACQCQPTGPGIIRLLCLLRLQPRLAGLRPQLQRDLAQTGPSPHTRWEESLSYPVEMNVRGQSFRKLWAMVTMVTGLHQPFPEDYNLGDMNGYSPESYAVGHMNGGDAW